jgi:hypothetical protein
MLTYDKTWFLGLVAFGEWSGENIGACVKSEVMNRPSRTLEDGHKQSINRARNGSFSSHCIEGDRCRRGIIVRTKLIKYDVSLPLVHIQTGQKKSSETRSVCPR